MMRWKGIAGAWLPALMAVWVLAGSASSSLAETEESLDPVTTQSLDDPGDPDRAIGVFGAVLCGAEANLIRTMPVIGMNPWALAAGIGGCLLVLLDVFGT